MGGPKHEQFGMYEFLLSIFHLSCISFEKILDDKYYVQKIGSSC